MRIHTHSVVCRLISVKEPGCIYIFLHGSETQKAPITGPSGQLRRSLGFCVPAAAAVCAFAAAVVLFAGIRLFGDKDQIAVHCQLKSALAHEYELSGAESGLHLGRFEVCRDGCIHLLDTLDVDKNVWADIPV